MRQRRQPIWHAALSLIPLGECNRNKASAKPRHHNSTCVKVSTGEWTDLITGGESHGRSRQGRGPISITRIPVDLRVEGAREGRRCRVARSIRPSVGAAKNVPTAPDTTQAGERDRPAN
jgi:hypothetical protein